MWQHTATLHILDRDHCIYHTVKIQKKRSKSKKQDYNQNPKKSEAHHTDYKTNHLAKHR